MQVYKYMFYLYYANTVLYYSLINYFNFFELDMFFMRLQAD